MKLNKLRCHNFRCFRDREFIFHEGITGIIGSNGKGKSRIVEAISFLATGELEGTKEEAITLGEATGYVTGEFEHDEKIITLERHLDASKVRLKYDGQDLKTAKEVKELWDKLLQINPEIFNNIIIAKQGDIPKLFSGDESDRTKIFQKIFLVPNTEKLRNIIWKDYIKELPPPFPVDDLQKIDEELVLKNAELLEEQEQLSRYDSYTLEKYQEQENLIKELELAKTNQAKRARLILDREGITVDLNAVHNRRLRLLDEISKAPFSIDQLRKQLKAFEEKKYQVETKDSLQKQLDETKVKIDELDIVSINCEYDKWNAAYKTASTAIGIAKANIEIVSNKLAKYAVFKGKPTCPTCGQSISELTKILTDFHDELTVNQTNLDNGKKDENKALAELKPLTAMRSEHDKLLRQFNVINGQLNQYVLVEYDSEEHELYKGVCSKLEETHNQVSGLNHEHELLLLKEKSINLAIANLHVKYIDNEDIAIDHDLDEAKGCATRLKAGLSLKQDIQTKVSVITQEISNLNRRIESNKGNKEKNDKRDAFEKMLLALYDAFHPNQFSKKVIQRYSHVVTDYLLANLTKFSIPYTANVNDNFGIDVIDEKGYKLPIVSGGQAMIIGLCLRLALLQLFAQNFSFIIIDEGSTGLHKINSEIYFDLIKNFPRSQFSQVLIIDHDEKLAEVVDHVIDLDKNG